MVNTINPKIQQAFQVLEDVMDPEIPVLSVLELGMINDIILEENGILTVEFIPTFSACPAIAYITDNIKTALLDAGLECNVIVNKYQKWSTDRISEIGKQKLENYGLATPNVLNGKEVEVEDLEHVQCPNCKSDATSLTNPFGSALCRSMHICHKCGQAFERIKPIG